MTSANVDADGVVAARQRMNLTALAIRRPLLVTMVFAALALLGAVAAFKLPVTELPKVSFPAVNVVVSDPGASSTAVQRQVTTVIEHAVQQIDGASSITGLSGPGISRVTVDLTSGADVNAAADQITQAVARATRQLPPQASTPAVNETNPYATPLLSVSFTGQDPTSLYRTVADTVQPALELDTGVGLVSLAGGTTTQADVLLDPTKLAARGVSLDQVEAAIANTDTDRTAGATTVGSDTTGTDAQVEITGAGESLTTLTNTVVGTGTGTPVTLGEVATVTQDAAPATTTSTLDGEPTVSLTITARDNANAITTDDAVKHTLAQLTAQLPAGVHYTIVNDTSSFTRSALSATAGDLALAVVLASLVLLLFLGSWRQGVIVLVAIPTSLLSTALLMYVFGFSLDLISLLALSLLIGILVDDSIVVIENITRHLRLGKPPAQAAYEGRTEIGAAAVALTLTDVVVFLPVVFTSGITGQILIEFGITLVAATLISLLVSFTLTPMLAARWLNRPAARVPSQSWLTPLRRVASRTGRALLDGYERLLRLALRRRPVVLLLGAGTLVASVLFLTTNRLPTSYVPVEDNATVQVNALLPAGTTLTGTADALNRLSTMITKQIRGVTDIQATAGGNTGGASITTNSGAMVVDLVPKQHRAESSSQIAAQITTLSRLIPGMRARATVPSPLVTPGGNGIQVVLSGPDTDTLTTLARNTEKQLNQLPQLSQALDLTDQATPDWQINVNPTQAAALGLTQQQVAAAVATAIGGTDPGTVQTADGDTEQINLHLATSVDEQTLLALPVATLPVAATTTPSTASGTATANSARTGAAAASAQTAAQADGSVTLGQVATLTHATSPQAISDDNGTPQVTVNAALAPGTSLSAAEHAVATAMHAVAMPAGYHYQLAGETKQQSQSFAPLLLALELSPLLLYMLLTALYESLVLPFSVLLAVPLATFGAFLALIWSGQTINLFSLIGLLMLIGLVSKNAILLVDRAEHHRAEGLGPVEAIVAAGRTRLRPIIMTTLVVVAAMLPVAFASAAGSEYREPMALVLIGGMTSSTLLTLLVVPVLFSYLDAARTRLGRRPTRPRLRRWRAVGPAARPISLDALLHGTEETTRDP